MIALLKYVKACHKERKYCLPLPQRADYEAVQIPKQIEIKYWDGKWSHGIVFSQNTYRQPTGNMLIVCWDPACFCFGFFC